MRLDRNQFKELIDTSIECTNLVVQTMTKRLTSIREYMRENNPLRVLVVDSQASEEARNVRAFLALNRIPYEWADVYREPERIPPWALAKSAGVFAIVDNSVFVGEPLTVRKMAVSLGISTWRNWNAKSVNKHWRLIF
jgi:thioredoxin reductase (NADPH)